MNHAKETPNQQEPTSILDSEEKYTKISNILKLLSNPNRLMILSILSEKARPVNEIHSILSEVTNISQSSLSQHLALLRAHRTVSFKKDGQLSTYYITDDRFTELLRMLLDVDLFDEPADQRF